MPSASGPRFFCFGHTTGYNPRMESRSPEGCTREIKEEAARLGFDACGIAPAEPIDPENRLGAWLRQGCHADMAWLERAREVRQDVRLKLEGARSVVVVAKNYYQPNQRLAEGAGRIARYAWGRDYHKVLLNPLRRLARHIGTLAPDVQTYAEVDTGPVLERAWAARAGIGWIGKNGLVVRRGLGSWFVLGAIVTTLDAAPDAPARDYCGNCRACIEACPTGAILSPRTLDARRCIAYHTIENRGAIPSPIQDRMGTWIFGCDRCQEVCPWNREVTTAAEPDFRPRDGAVSPNLEELLRLDEPQFRQRFEGSAILRAKHAGLLRNAGIALRNLSKS